MLEQLLEAELWVAIAFAIFIGILIYVGVPKLITNSLDDRAKRIKAESEAALAAYEKSLADARNRAQTIGGETRDKLHAQAEERRKVLEAALNAKLADAEKQIAGTKATAMANVRGIAVDAAAAIVERLIGTAPAGAAVEAAVDTALKR